MLAFILFLIVVVNTAFLIRLLYDSFQHKQAVAVEPGSAKLLSFSSMGIFFLSSFGMPDFAISTLLYRAKKWVPDHKLPGTLNAQGVIPTAVMSLFFIEAVQIDMTTLLICIASQMLGAYLGPRIVVKFSAALLRRFICGGLIMAAFFIVAGKFNLFAAQGNAMALHGTKLLLASAGLFSFGVLNNIGIGCFPLTMALIYMLGMNPLAAFPIMMGACAFSLPIGGSEFIRLGQYNRKIALFANFFGTIGVLLAVCVVKELNVSMLQWIVAGILLYSGVNMFVEEWKLSVSTPKPQTV